MSHSFSIVGSGDEVATIRESFLADLEDQFANNPSFSDLKVSELAELDFRQREVSAKVRSIDSAELLVAFVVHIPAGVAAHFAYDWCRAWFASRRGNTHVSEERAHE